MSGDYVFTNGSARRDGDLWVVETQEGQFAFLSKEGYDPFRKASTVKFYATYGGWLEVWREDRPNSPAGIRCYPAKKLLKVGRLKRLAYVTGCAVVERHRAGDTLLVGVLADSYRRNGGEEVSRRWFHDGETYEEPEGLTVKNATYAFEISSAPESWSRGVMQMHLWPGVNVDELVRRVTSVL